MTAAYAAGNFTWRYPTPYDLYDMSDADAAILTSADGGFFALVRALGFGHAVSFRATTDGRSYEILTRPESTAPPGACGGCHVNAPTESAQLRAPSAGTAPRA